MSFETNRQDRLISRLNKDRVFASGTLILAAYLGYQAFSYPVESAFFPRVLSVLLGLLALLLIIRLSLRQRKERSVGKTIETDASTLSAEWRAIRSAGMVFTSIIIYGLLLTLVNYELASIIYLAAMMLIFGFRRPVITGSISVGLTVLLYTIFFHLLGVSRPESLLFM